jgi:hypothetical protein
MQAVLVEGKVNLSLSSFGAALLYLQHNLIDQEILSMGIVKAYILPASCASQRMIVQWMSARNNHNPKREWKPLGIPRFPKSPMQKIKSSSCTICHPFLILHFTHSTSASLSHPADCYFSPLLFVSIFLDSLHSFFA